GSVPIRRAQEESGATETRQGIGRQSGVLSAEEHGAVLSAVSGIEDVDAVAPVLKAGVDYMPIVRKHNVVRKLNYRATEVLLNSARTNSVQGSRTRLTWSPTVEPDERHAGSYRIAIRNTKLLGEIAN